MGLDDLGLEVMGQRVGGGRTILHVSVRRYRCPQCAHMWRQDMSQAADPRAKLSRAAVR